jgi:hypothetical protein
VAVAAVAVAVALQVAPLPKGPIASPAVMVAAWRQEDKHQAIDLRPKWLRATGTLTQTNFPM